MFCSDECKKARIKARYQERREERLQYSRIWRAEHPDAAERFKTKHPNYERDRWRKIRGTKEYHKTCVICGMPFVTVRPQKITCSDECSRKR
jgi:predicted nucleic acid-binding Zn ribbon protein